jgi:gluconate kinase
MPEPATTAAVQLLFLFGKSGAGKSFVARICAEELGFQAYEGDQDLTPEMQEAIAEQRPFTPEMRSRFAVVLGERVAAACAELAMDHPGIAVSQGLFKEQQRSGLARRFPSASWIWVRAEDETLHARLAKRAGHAASASYAERINVGFEPPTLAHDVIDNDHDRANVVQQLRRLLDC